MSSRAPHGTRASLGARLLLVAAGSAAAVALAELALRTVVDEVPWVTVRCPRPEIYQRYDPHGYRLWPSRTTTYSYPPDAPREIQLVANRHGFRGSRELDEADARRRLLVLGDSFVFGEGVHEWERFTDVLEELRPDLRVDNLGMTGFGPDLMLRALEHVGVSLQPDAVLLCIYTDDIRRVRPHYAGVGYEIPRYVLREGRLLTAPYPWWRCGSTCRLSAEPPSLERLRVVRMFQGAHDRWRYGSKSWVDTVSQTEADWDLNAAILDRFAAVCAQSGVSLFVAFLPGVEDTNADKRRRRWLRESSQARDLPFVDLTRAVLESPAEELFLAGNPHYNAAGHRVVAEKLDDFLTRADPW